ncbi:MAG: hypothetical protein M0010_06180 [Actinomycetota bacterium]|nr:hypothetical protein [Actinomycetota bacterium]
MHIGTTTVENLLRVARRDTAAGTAFVALEPAGRAFEIISVPEPGSAEGLSVDEVAELVRQASADPEFVHARVFVRSGRVGRSVTLAVAPLRSGGGHSMIGLVAEPDRRFEASHLEILGQLAERLVRHLDVIQQLSRGGRLGGALEDLQAEGRDLGAEGRDLRADDRDLRADDRDLGAEGRRRNGATVPEGPELPLGVGARVPSEVPDQERPAVAMSLPDAPWAAWWTDRDPLTGLQGLGKFFSRAGRLRSSEGGSAGTFVLVVLELPDDRTLQVAASVLAGVLRSTDPVGRVGERLLAAALLIADGSSGDSVERRLAAAVDSALDRPSAVRTAHVAAAHGDGRDVDELLRDALFGLHDRQAGGGGAPWRGAGGSAARLPIP